MNKIKTKSPASTEMMRTEYDFSQAVTGKHHKAYRQGHQVTIRKNDGTTVVQNFKLEEGAVVLDQDVRKYFTNAEAVNNALRALIAIIPSKPGRVRS